jgi:hypothetical protein
MCLASLVAAAVPDPGSPTTIALAAVLGAFLGAAIGRAQGQDRDGMRNTAEDYSFGATAFAILAYLISLVTNL